MLKKAQIHHHNQEMSLIQAPPHGDAQEVIPVTSVPPQGKAIEEEEGAVVGEAVDLQVISKFYCTKCKKELVDTSG